jgi:transcriptional regulator with XRE-family HTH domain
VIDTLEGDLDCLVDDAAKRGITERSAEELLLTVAVLDWLRGGNLPGKGALDFMEEHVAVMNSARHDDEVELRDALRAVLEELSGAQREAIAAGRWSERELNAETALGRRLRRFGRNLDGLRRSRGLTIGELADRADMDVVNVVAFIVGAEEPGADALWMLAGALSTDPGELFPPEPGAMPDGPSLDTVIGDLPAPDREEDGADPTDEDAAR